MAHLDTKLLDKIAAKLGKKKRAQVNVMVSKRASRLGISSEAALILIAKENNIGTAWYQRCLDPVKQTEIRDNLLSILPHSAKQAKTKTQNKGKSSKITPRMVRRNAIEYLLQDDTLRGRCLDNLLGNRNFDIAINQATLVLEDRIRTKAQPLSKLVGENLVNYAFNEDVSRTVLRVSTNQDEQRGFTQIIRGIVPAFRNLTHHHVTTKFSREDGMRVCGFIDVLLRVVDKATKIK
jgi:uncharacterized protein (TIGR02391 family)